MSVHVFGIRHHGPGCARSVVAALEELSPDIVLIEGPPDADDALSWLASEELKPPVALLVYPPDEPQRAVFFPFAVFSPEWQAMKYAANKNVPLRFMDLPQSMRFARRKQREEAVAAERGDTEPAQDAPPEATPNPPIDSPPVAEATSSSGATEAEPSAAPSTTAPTTPAAETSTPPTADAPVSELPSAETLQAEFGPAIEQTPPELTPQEKFALEVRADPLGALARAAGYTDRELWWDRMVEQRRDPAGLFEGILEAMAALRDEVPIDDEEELLREAYMRRTIRAAVKEGFQRIAVICGAWHAPMLVDHLPSRDGPPPTDGPKDDVSPTDGMPGKRGKQGSRARKIPTAKEDDARLRGLKKTKTAATWIPWTHSRLSFRSGYGAGVDSPGWYQHVWDQHVADHAGHAMVGASRAVVAWVTRAAHLLRSADLDASSASVIDTIRLSETLASLRGARAPGLTELNDALLAVLCGGNDSPLKLIRDRLEIGERIGTVPGELPTVPLQRDLEAQQKLTRLKPATSRKSLALDLRETTDRRRSLLLHRLRVLGVEWGELDRARGTGTFKELWQLEWKVEYIVALIEASPFGNTIESAASNKLISEAEKSRRLPELSERLRQAILADLPAAIDRVLVRLRNLAAVSADVRHLMEALPPLAQVARYGDVRQSRGVAVLAVVRGFLERIVVGLPAACASLDDDAAAEMLTGFDHVQQAVTLLADSVDAAPWQGLLRHMASRDGTHGLVRGYAARLLVDAKLLGDDELDRLAHRALSAAVPAAQAGAWIQGLLRGSGMVLLHQDRLWHAIDAWLRTLGESTFNETLPLLRRAFSQFQPAERRRMGEKVKTLGGGDAATSTRQVASVPIDHARAARVLPVLAQILGVELPASEVRQR